VDYFWGVKRGRRDQNNYNQCLLPGGVGGGGWGRVGRRGCRRIGKKRCRGMGWIGIKDMHKLK